MPMLPKRPCRFPGCPHVTTDKSGYCPECKTRVLKNYDATRETAVERGYTHRWQKARKMFLNDNPLCVRCLQEGRTTPANVVDHIIPHKGDYDRFWDQSNWQALCAYHHSKKTASEDGGFGNK